MTIVMYTDCIKGIGYISEEWWDEWTWENGNLVEIDVPENILRSYYLEELAEDYHNISFEQWYSEEFIADDMDGLFEYTDWRPFLADIVSWRVC